MILAQLSPAALYLLIMVLAVFLAPAWAVVQLIAKSGSPQPLVKILPNTPPAFAKLPADILGFVSAHGLTPTDVMLYVNTPFVIFQEPPGPPPQRSMVVMYSGGKYVSEFCTDFSENESLTTSRGHHAFFLPRRPGAYLQGFMNLSIDELWARHLEGEAFLLGPRKVQVGPRVTAAHSVAARVEFGQRRQTAYVKTVPLYWLKAPYWFWVKRHLMRNKTIARQFPVGTSTSA